MFTKKNQNIQVAAQNCSSFGFGAYTGEVTPEQLKDINIEWVIIGHSERRTHFGETNQTLAKKVEIALKAGLKVIYCFGETLAQRENNETIKVVEEQLDAVKPLITNWSNVVLAYEPVWAIGTGKNATSEQVQEIHQWIRSYLQKIDETTEATRIIYGGSVTEKNCNELIQIKNVDGFLVGGASLKEAFLQIVKSKKN
jgi:triosephosphate isomerase